MENTFNPNDPYIWSSAGKKRKEEVIFDFLKYSKIIDQHVMSCPVTRDGNFEVDCLICKKFSLMINILVQCENNKNSGKLDVKAMVEKGIVDYMIFGAGIKLQ